MNGLAEPGVGSAVLAPGSVKRRTKSGDYRWLLLAILLIAAVLRVCVAGRNGLWPDEIFSLAIATGHSVEHPAAAANVNLGDFVEPNHAVPAEEFRRYLRHDNPPATPARVLRAVLLSDTSPPLYYLLLYGWTLLFGTSDLAVRLFSTACSLACLPLIAAIARQIGGRGTAIASCMLFALSPLAIYYSTEGRMYSLLWLCVLASTWASLVLQQRGGSIAIYASWIVASVAGFLTHYFFVFPWLAMVAYLLIKPGRLRRVQFVTCALITSALIFPWYIKLPVSLASWRITGDWLKWRPPGFHYLSALRDTLFQFFSGHERHLWDGRRRSSLIALVLFASSAAVMLWKMRLRVFGRGRLLLGLLFAAACLGPLVFDFVERTYTIAVPRYAIAALPAAYLLAGYAVACFGGRMRIVMLALIVLAWSPNLFSLYRSRLPWLPLREIARSASVNGAPSDLILVHSIPSGVLGVARYVTGQAAMASWVGQLGNRRTPESLQQLAAGRTRIVLVKVHEVGQAAPEEEWLRANAVVRHETRLESGLVVDFRPRTSETF
jgi:uncharacterized membrane protein